MASVMFGRKSIDDSLRAGIDHGKPEPGFEGKLPIGWNVEVRASRSALEGAGQGREAIVLVAVSTVREKQKISGYRNLERIGRWRCPLDIPGPHVGGNVRGHSGRIRAPSRQPGRLVEPFARVAVGKKNADVGPDHQVNAAGVVGGVGIPSFDPQAIGNGSEEHTAELQSL